MNYHLDDSNKAERLTLEGKFVVCCACDEEMVIAAVCDNEPEARQYIAENIDASDETATWFIYRLPLRLQKPQPNVPDFDDEVPF